MAILDFDFEVGAEGPKFVWRRPFRRRTQAEIARGLQESLRIDSEAARLAKDGIPAPDDTAPSALQQAIWASHLGWMKALVKRARKRLALDANELGMLATDVTDGDVDGLVATHAAVLGGTESRFLARIRPLLQRKIKTEGARKEFEHLNKTDDQPTARTAVEFVGSTIIAAIVDSVVSGFLFKEQMGVYSAVGFASGVGMSLALVGMVTGIGWARLKRPSAGRKAFGAALFALGLASAAALFFVVSHYRLALVGRAPDRATAVQASIEATPALPFYDVPLLLFLCINLGALWLISAKAATMFGWLDLARRRKAAARAARRVQNCYDLALSLCDNAKVQGEAALQALNERVVANNAQAKAVLVRSKETLDEFGEWSKGVATAFLACEQHYREVVQSVHPAGTYQPRFAQPPEPLPEETLELDVAVHAMAMAIEARSVAFRERRPELIGEVSAATDAARDRITAMLADIEADLRMNGSRPYLRAVK